MKFDADSLCAFLKDTPFYANNECFCLGDTLDEAGDIVRRIVEANWERKESDVGMDFKGTTKGGKGAAF